MPGRLARERRQRTVAIQVAGEVLLAPGPAPAGEESTVDVERRGGHRHLAASTVRISVSWWTAVSRRIAAATTASAHPTYSESTQSW